MESNPWSCAKIYIPPTTPHGYGARPTLVMGIKINVSINMLLKYFLHLKPDSMRQRTRATLYGVCNYKYSDSTCHNTYYWTLVLFNFYHYSAFESSLSCSPLEGIEMPPRGRYHPRWESLTQMISNMIKK